MSVCVYVCMDGWMYGWMDGWIHASMHACMYVCIYGPVSSVPESVSLGDHTIGGGQGSGVRTHTYPLIMPMSRKWSKSSI